MVYTIPTNISNPSQLLYATNKAIGGYMGLGFLFVIFSIAFTSLIYRYPPSKAGAGAMFITSFSGYIFYEIGIITNIYYIVTLILLTAIFAVLSMGEDNY